MPVPAAIDIRRRLAAFAREWAQACSEVADAKLLWARFDGCFGIRPESATLFGKAADTLGGARGFIDSFIPGKLIVEHKSRGKNAWLRAVGSRLESRYRYSASIVYDNFPWPEPTEKRGGLPSKPQAQADARPLFRCHSGRPLRPACRIAPCAPGHNARAVDAAYGYKDGHADMPHVAYLFSLYQRRTSVRRTRAA